MKEQPLSIAIMLSNFAPSPTSHPDYLEGHQNIVVVFLVKMGGKYAGVDFDTLQPWTFGREL